MSKTAIRWMIGRDMGDVMRIENACFTRPWKRDDLVRCLKERNCIGMVAETNGSILGFMVYELLKNCLNVIDFAVLPECQRQGIGQQMVNKLMGKLSNNRRTKITLEIRESNLAAQLFFRSQGFKAIRILKSYFKDNKEDCYLFRFELSNTCRKEPA